MCSSRMYTMASYTIIHSSNMAWEIIWFYLSQILFSGGVLHCDILDPFGEKNRRIRYCLWGVTLLHVASTPDIHLTTSNVNST